MCVFYILLLELKFLGAATDVSRCNASNPRLPRSQGYSPRPDIYRRTFATTADGWADVRSLSPKASDPFPDAFPP